MNPPSYCNTMESIPETNPTDTTTPPTNNNSTSHHNIDSQVREIGHHAIWSLSTAKPGNGVEQLRDGINDTFWQSDGG